MIFISLLRSNILGVANKEGMCSRGLLKDCLLQLNFENNKIGKCKTTDYLASEASVMPVGDEHKNIGVALEGND